MSTLLELSEGLARDLRDPEGTTFDADTLRDLINSALAEVSRIAPLEMFEEIPPGDGKGITLATSSASDDIIDTTSAHGFSVNQQVKFTSLTGGLGLVVDTLYWVVSASLGTTTFRVSATRGGAPIAFTTDITAGTVVGQDFEYATRITEPHRVEVWETSPVVRPYAVVEAGPAEYSNTSEAGWEVWNGKLRLPYRWVELLRESTYVLKVWGYGPRLRLVDLTQEAELDDDTEWAVREYATFRGYDRLMTDRVLFTQWQTSSNNTDVSPAGLMNALSLWQQRWDRRRKQLQTLRIAP